MSGRFQNTHPRIENLKTVSDTLFPFIRSDLRISPLVANRKPTLSSVSAAVASSAGLPAIGDLLLVALYLCRLLVPAEGVEQGQTLWIAAAWLAYGACRFWVIWRSGQKFNFHLGVVDLGVGALVAGHVLSALLVLTGTGDRRAALNGCWEWISIGIMWLLLKEALQRVETRRLISWCLLVSVITLAGLGIWQHFVWYPQQSRQLTELFELQSMLEAGRALSPAEKASYDQLRSVFGTDDLMLEAGGRQLLLSRTRDSREPIGRFALANSFAALLIIGWFGACDQVRQVFKYPRSRVTRLAIGLAVVPISICLLLTKSRTAMLGVCTGLLWLAVRLVLHSGPQRRLIWRWGGVFIGLSLGLVGVLILSGGLDWQVLSEAPKSLAYRQEYWQSTWKMIQDHPFFGVGPGNFRQHYFAYKLPGASEEILDPHNLILDVWANGGILALAGLMILIGTWGWHLWSTPPVFPDDTSTVPSLLRAGSLAGLCTMSVTLAEEWLLEGFFDQNLIWLAVGWLGMHVYLSLCIVATELSLPAALAAGTALLIHLLGAGGIGMPAILQLLLLLILLTSPAQLVRCRWSGRTLFLMTGMAAALFLGALWSGVVPVVTVARLMDQGRAEAIIEHRPVVAEKYFREAAQADTLAAGPHMELAGLLFNRWQRTTGQNDELFAAAIQEQAAAQQRNPLAAKEYLTLSNWWLQRYERSPQAEFATAAVSAAETGVALYPNFSRLHAQLAKALHAANRSQKAAEAARRAMELDDLNRQRGHIDKVLPLQQREELLRIAND